jgi:hypothetical protein
MNTGKIEFGGALRSYKGREICIDREPIRGKRCGRLKKHMIFWMGGIGYGLIEVLWRGRTHWSMVLTGGACLLAICCVNKRLAAKNIFLRSAACAAAVTAVEFAVGVLVNLWWGMNVWDYGGMRGNVLGQICPLYSFLWFLLCIPICIAAGTKSRKQR